MTHTWRVFIFPCLVIGLVFSGMGCETTAPRQERSPPPAPGAAEIAPAEPAGPPELITLDPAEDRLSAPWGGLRVLHVGVDLKASENVVVLFHGYGARGDDLESLAERFHERVPASYVLPEAPFALGGGGRAWFRRDRSNFDEGLTRARAVVDHLRREFGKVRLVIGGFSQGAMITANLLANADEKLVGALIFSPANHLTNVPAEDVPHPPLLLSHGTRDRILPFSEGVGLRERLQRLGYQVSWVEFEGRHQIPPLVVDQATEFLSDALAGN